MTFICLSSKWKSVLKVNSRRCLEGRNKSADSTEIILVKYQQLYCCLNSVWRTLKTPFVSLRSFLKHEKCVKHILCLLWFLLAFSWKLFRYLFHQLNHNSATGIQTITKFGLVITDHVYNNFFFEWIVISKANFISSNWFEWNAWTCKFKLQTHQTQCENRKLIKQLQLSLDCFINHWFFFFQQSID